MEYIYRRSSVRDSSKTVLLVAHSVIASGLLVPAFMIQYLIVQHHMPWERVSVPLIFAGVCALAMTIALKKSGLRMLRTASLVPVVMIVGIIVRVGSPLLDSALSARPLAEQLRPRIQNIQVAVFEAPRETEFGLQFYLNRQVPRYERGEIPAEAHLVIAPADSQSVVERSVAGRPVSYLGAFGAQGLDYFLVSATVAGRH